MAWLGRFGLHLAAALGATGGRYVETGDAGTLGRSSGEALDKDQVGVAAEGWASIVDALRGTVSRQQFETWFRAMRPVSLAPGRYVFGVPNAFLKSWIESYYSDLLRNCVESAFGASASGPEGRPPEIRIEVFDGAFTYSPMVM